MERGMRGKKANTSDTKSVWAYVVRFGTFSKGGRYLAARTQSFRPTEVGLILPK